MQMVAMSVLPESPVWLRWKGRSVEAGRAAKRLLGSQWEAEEVMDAPYEREEQEPLVSAFAHEVFPYTKICDNAVANPLSRRFTLPPSGGVTK
jgi:hypothetical protein